MLISVENVQYMCITQALVKLFDLRMKLKRKSNHLNEAQTLIYLVECLRYGEGGFPDVMQLEGPRCVRKR